MNKQMEWAESLKSDFEAKVRRFIDDDCAPGAAESFLSKFHVSEENAGNWIDEKGVYLQSEFACDIAIYGGESELWAHWVKRALHGRRLLSLIKNS